MLRGPDKTGEFRLSSEKYLAESYYLFGYSYEDSEFYRYRFEKDPLPDIINEGTRVLDGQKYGWVPLERIHIFGGWMITSARMIRFANGMVG